MNNKDKQNGRYVWVPITAWYGDGQGNIHGIDIDDTDVVAMRKLISKKRDASYWSAVLHKAQNKRGAEGQLCFWAGTAYDNE